jgi:hypothetical protein
MPMVYDADLGIAEVFTPVPESVWFAVALANRDPHYNAKIQLLQGGVNFSHGRQPLPKTQDPLAAGVGALVVHISMYLSGHGFSTATDRE